MLDVYSHVTSFLPHHVARPIREVYLSMTISRLATGMILVFEPIFLYSIGLTIPQILMFFLYGSLWYFLFTPLVGRLVLKWGTHTTIPVSTLFLIGYIATLLAMQWSIWFGLLGGILLGVRKSLYFVSMHYNFAKYAEAKEEGREVGVRQSIEVFVSALGPFLGGLLVTISSFNVVFIVAAVLLLVSNLPFLYTHAVKPKESGDDITLSNAVKKLLEKKERPLVLSAMGYGEIVVSNSLWPLFLSIFVFSSLFSLGSVIALSTFITVISLLFVGRLSDHSDKRKVLRASSIVYAFLWWLRPFVTAITGVFILDSATKFTRQIVMVPQTALVYDRARRERHPMMTSVTFILSIVTGKSLIILMGLIAFLLLPTYYAWVALFVLAGGFSLLYGVE